MSTHKSTSELNFRQWGILDEQMQRFENVLRETKRVLKGAKVVVYGWGSPRNFSVITKVRFKDREILKVIRIDIRDGSCDTWLEKFDAMEWSASRF